MSSALNITHDTFAVRSRPLSPNAGPLPLLLEPASKRRDLASLIHFLNEKKSWLEQELLAAGALLLRGFEINRASDFEQVAKAISPKLQNDYLGTSPRDALTEYVFSASELPPFYPIPEHCEMSFLPNPPERLFFSCLVEPRNPGGETPLVDFRAVLRCMDPAVRERFEQKGVRIIRNYSGPEGGPRFDLWKLKRWDEIFRTTDRNAIEERCQKLGFECTWKEGGMLRLVHTQPAVRAHPITGEPVWFNHSQVFHLSSAPDEYRRILKRQDWIELHCLELLSKSMVFAKKRFVKTEDQALHCTFGDGTPIADSDMNAVRDAIWQNMVIFPWQRGDVVVIDNAAIAHGRMPYRGPRLVVVAWS